MFWITCVSCLISKLSLPSRERRLRIYSLLVNIGHLMWFSVVSRCCGRRLRDLFKLIVANEPIAIESPEATPFNLYRSIAARGSKCSPRNAQHVK
jgi:hypothetical protein